MSIDDGMVPLCCASNHPNRVGPPTKSSGCSLFFVRILPFIRFVGLEVASVAVAVMNLTIFISSLLVGHVETDGVRSVAPLSVHCQCCCWMEHACEGFSLGVEVSSAKPETQTRREKKDGTNEGENKKRRRKKERNTREKKNEGRDTVTRCRFVVFFDDTTCLRVKRPCVEL